ncbi:hypothetical protein SAMN02745866_03712 [Alteromonadaceae bacterium Bs31]|nr:hypothetical protein SAMN02745866_03712 [Alteromonadaceae bacterium Bs31]
MPETTEKPLIEIKLQASPNGQPLVSGKFTIEYGKNGLNVEGAQALKHIVVAITERGSHQVFAPFKDVAVFPDDVKYTGKGCTGFFNVNIFEHSQLVHPADYFVCCSLGTLVSNVLKVAKPLK